MDIARIISQLLNIVPSIFGFFFPTPGVGNDFFQIFRRLIPVVNAFL